MKKWSIVIKKGNLNLIHPSAYQTLNIGLYMWPRNTFASHLLRWQQQHRLVHSCSPRVWPCVRPIPLLLWSVHHETILPGCCGRHHQLPAGPGWQAGHPAALWSVTSWTNYILWYILNWWLWYCFILWFSYISISSMATVLTFVRIPTRPRSCPSVCLSLIWFLSFFAFFAFSNRGILFLLQGSREFRHYLVCYNVSGRKRLLCDDLPTSFVP